jgi:hypothetical protein
MHIWNISPLSIAHRSLLMRLLFSMSKLLAPLLPSTIHKDSGLSLGLVMPACKPSYLGDGSRRIVFPGQQKHDTISEKQNKIKRGWGCGSSSGALA